MDIIRLLGELFSDYTLRTIALGAGILGIISGALGSFAVLRRQSLLGDAMSHAALPGIALAFLFTRSKEPFVLVLGAAAAGWIATLLVLAIVRNTRIKQDTALGLALSVFFGFGLVLLTFIQKLPDATQAGLDRFLFGQAAALLESDVITMVILGGTAVVVLLFLWKEFKLLSFDPDFAASLGFPVRRLDVLLTTLLVLAIVVGLQTVGVVLMSAMVVAPAVAARQWTDRLAVMVGLSAFFGALAGVSGAFLSSTTERLPTGPTIVLCISAVALFSIFLAPNRGLTWSWLRHQRNRQRLRVEAVLSDLYALAQHHKQLTHGHSVAVLRAMETERGGIDRSLDEMAQRGWAQKVSHDEWALTEQGIDEARRLAHSRTEDDA